jgi:hypothetical protein
VGLIDFSLGDIGEVIKDVREAITGEAIEDPTKKAEIELKLRELEQAINLGQIEINKNEASNANWFVAGWRPAIGWVGAFALGYTYIISPLIDWGCALANLHIATPRPDMGMLFNLILAMLGFGGMRTYEKIKNVQNLH